MLTEFACAHVLVHMTFNFICSPDGQWYLRNAELFNKKYGLIKPYFPGAKSHAFLQKLCGLTEVLEMKEGKARRSYFLRYYNPVLLSPV